MLIIGETVCGWVKSGNCLYQLSNFSENLSFSLNKSKTIKKKDEIIFSNTFYVTQYYMQNVMMSKRNQYENINETFYIYFYMPGLQNAIILYTYRSLQFRLVIFQVLSLHPYLSVQDWKTSFQWSQLQPSVHWEEVHSWAILIHPPFPFNWIEPPSLVSLLKRCLTQRSVDIKSGDKILKLLNLNSSGGRNKQRPTS